MIVYRHRRLDNLEIFYVGIGKTNKRAYSCRSRNKHWKNIVNKTKYVVEIVHICDSWDEACEIEQLMIQEYGRKDLKTGCLVNMTDGGDGSVGLIRTKQHCERIGLGNKGKKMPRKFVDKLTKLLSKEVLMYNQNGKLIDRFNSTKEAELETNIPNGNISSVCNGKRKTAGGYIWKYKETIND